MNLCRRAFAVLFVFPLLACGADDSPAGDTQSAADAAVADAPGSAVASGRGGPITEEEIRSHRLTMSQLEDWIAAQEAYVARLEADPQLLQAELERRRQLDENQDEVEAEAEAGAMAASLEGFAPLRNVLREHGMTPREFTLTTIAFTYSMVAHAAPNTDLESEMNPQNMELIRTNQEEVESIASRVRAVQQRLDALVEEQGYEEDGE